MTDYRGRGWYRASDMLDDAANEIGEKNRRRRSVKQRADKHKISAE